MEDQVVYAMKEYLYNYKICLSMMQDVRMWKVCAQQIWKLEIGSGMVIVVMVELLLEWLKPVQGKFYSRSAIYPVGSTVFKFITDNNLFPIETLLLILGPFAIICIKPIILLFSSVLSTTTEMKLLVGRLEW